MKLVWAQPAQTTDRDQAMLRSLKELGVTVEADTADVAEQRWKSGKLPVMLEAVDGSYRLRVNSYLAMQAMSIVSVVEQGFMQVQAHEAGLAGLARIPFVRESPGGHHDGPYAAFLLPGMLGLNLLMMGVFAIGTVDVDLRVNGIYKRLATTPLPRHLYLTAQMTVRFIIVFTSAALLIAVGALAFGVYSQGSYWSLAALIMLGTACFASMGYVLASFAGSVEVMNGLANLVFMPLMMLSGVYFSLDSAPAWLQKTADLLPLTPLLKALRAVFNDGASLASQGNSILIIAIWTAGLFLVATRRFKWV